MTLIAYNILAVKKLMTDINKIMKYIKKIV